MTVKSIRFLKRYYTQIYLLALGFWAIVLVGLYVTRSLDHIFGSYYRTFPMMTCIITGVGAVAQYTYRNVALGMNAGRKGLYWANQSLMAGVVLLSALLSVTLWQLGGSLVPGENTPSLWVAIPMSAAALLAGEGGFVVAHGKGTLQKVLFVIYTILLAILCMATMVVMMIVTEEQVIFGDFLTLGVVTAALLLASAGLAVFDFQLMKKAVVQ